MRPHRCDCSESITQQIASGSVIILGKEVGGKVTDVELTSCDGRKGWINRLAVDPAHHRKGYGSQLIAA